LDKEDLIMEDISLRKLNEIRLSKLHDYLDFIKKEWQNNLPLDKFMIRSMIETLEDMERSN
jgi:hypothetical protein